MLPGFYLPTQSPFCAWLLSTVPKAQLWCCHSFTQELLVFPYWSLFHSKQLSLQSLKSPHLVCFLRTSPHRPTLSTFQHVNSPPGPALVLPLDFGVLQGILNESLQHL